VVNFLVNEIKLKSLLMNVIVRYSAFSVLSTFA